MSASINIQEITASILAILTVIGAFLLVLYDTVEGRPIDVPMWITLMIGAIVGSYFTHAASINGARKAGVAAAQAAVDTARLTPPVGPNA